MIHKVNFFLKYQVSEEKLVSTQCKRKKTALRSWTKLPNSPDPQFSPYVKTSVAVGTGCDVDMRTLCKPRPVCENAISGSYY